MELDLCLSGAAADGQPANSLTMNTSWERIIDEQEGDRDRDQEHR